MAQNIEAKVMAQNEDVLDTTNIADLYELYNEIFGFNIEKILEIRDIKNILNDKFGYYISIIRGDTNRPNLCDKYVYIEGQKYKHLWVYKGNLAHTFICEADNIVLKMESKISEVSRNYCIDSMKKELLLNNLFFTEFKLPVPEVITKELVIIDDRHVKATKYSGCSIVSLSKTKIFGHIIDNIHKLLYIIELFSKKRIYLVDFNPNNVLYNIETNNFIFIDFEQVTIRDGVHRPNLETEPVMSKKEVYDYLIHNFLGWLCLQKYKAQVKKAVDDFNEQRGGSYSQIVNPETGRKVNIYGKIGQSVLKQYLEFYN